MNHRVAGPGPGVFYLQVVNAVLRQQRHFPVVSHRARAGHRSRYVQVGVAVLANRVQQVRRHPVGKNSVEIGRFPGVAGVLQKSVNGRDAVGLAGKQSGQPVRCGVVFPQIMGEKRRRAVVAPDAVAQLVRPVHQRNIGAAQVGKHTVRRITRPRYRQLRQALVQPGSFRRIGVPMDGVLQFVGQHPQVAFAGKGYGVGVNVDGRNFVAIRTHRGGIQVRAGNIAANAGNPSVDDMTPPAAAQFRYHPESRADPGVHPFLRLPHRALQVGLGHRQAVLNPPVGVFGSGRQLKSFADHPAARVVHHPELRLVAHLRRAGGEARRRRGGLGPAPTQLPRQSRQIPIRRDGKIGGNHRLRRGRQRSRRNGGNAGDAGRYGRHWRRR